MVLKVVNKFNRNNFFKDFEMELKMAIGLYIVITKVCFTPFMYWYYPAEF